MSRLFYHTMQDSLGNLLLGVSGTMRLAGSGTLATIYGDEAMTVPIANPMTNHPSYGSFKCYLGPGEYDFYMAKVGYSFETLSGVQGYGSMAKQNANAVTITGGIIDNINLPLGTIAGQNANAVAITGGFIEHLVSLNVDGLSGINSPPESASQLVLYWDKIARRALRLVPLGSDSGYETILFQNIAGVTVGTISSTNTTTSYATTSDARLKHAIAPLTGALDVVRALNPVAFRWRLDDSPGRGFLAHEVAEVVEGVITGEKDALDDEGTIKPQQIDHSKLVVWLVGAVKELTQQVEMLQAQLAAGV